MNFIIVISLLYHCMYSTVPLNLLYYVLVFLLYCIIVFIVLYHCIYSTKSFMYCTLNFIYCTVPFPVLYHCMYYILPFYVLYFTTVCTALYPCIYCTVPLYLLYSTIVFTVQYHLLYCTVPLHIGVHEIQVPWDPCVGGGPDRGLGGRGWARLHQHPQPSHCHPYTGHTIFNQ